MNGSKNVCRSFTICTRAPETMDIEDQCTRDNTTPQGVTCAAAFPTVIYTGPIFKINARESSTCVRVYRT